MFCANSKKITFKTQSWERKEENEKKLKKNTQVFQNQTEKAISPDILPETNKKRSHTKLINLLYDQLFYCIRPFWRFVTTMPPPHNLK